MLELLKEVKIYIQNSELALECEHYIEDIEMPEIYDKVCQAINEIEDYKDISERLERAKRDPGTELDDYIKELYEERYNGTKEQSIQGTKD